MYRRDTVVMEVFAVAIRREHFDTGSSEDGAGSSSIACLPYARASRNENQKAAWLLF